MRIITATNDDKNYLQFADLVPHAWKKLIPEARIMVGHVSWQVNGELIIPDAEVRQFTPEPDIPTCNLAKISRLIMASEMGDEVCILTDMDMMPLSRYPFHGILTSKHNGALTCYGGDAYEQEGRFPICYLIGTGNMFKALVNPKGLSYKALLDSWKRRRLDHKDNISNLPFSDESLVRALIKENEIPMKVLKRGWVNNVAKGRVDRTRWVMLGKGAIDAHLPKPYEKNRKKIAQLEKIVGV